MNLWMNTRMNKRTNTLVRQMVLIMFMWLMLAGVCLGKEVFLKDGGIIDGQSAWRKGNKVFVKVNRDIVADFNLEEIDLRRTFPKSGSSPRRTPRKAAAATATGATGSASPVPAVAKPGPKPAGQPKPAGAAPAPKPVVPSPQPVAAPAAAEAATTPDKPGVQSTPQDAAKMMTEAVMKKDSELMKKALEMQKSAMQQQNSPAQKKPGFPVSILLITLAVCLLIIAGQWVIFQKAGQAGWKSLIPFYNMYILMIIAGKPGWWMFLLLVPLVGLAVYLFAMLSLAKKFGRSELFGVGLLLLPMIFFPLLAFGGSEYEG